jgi:hypothetical protein
MTSALVQAPSLLAMIPKHKKIGILTFDDTRLGAAHLQNLDINPLRCFIKGAPANGALQRHIRNGDEYKHEQISRELVAAARDMVGEVPEVAAVLLECTNMPPFAEDIQAAVGLPVYDIYTAGNWFYSALVNSRPRTWGAIPLDDSKSRT